MNIMQRCLCVAVVALFPLVACEEAPMEAGRPCRVDDNDCPQEFRCVATSAGAICVPPTDFDGDGVLDEVDACAQSVLSFVSAANVDHDGDGCHDVREDSDDDADGRSDDIDACPLGASDFISTAASDIDRDGCADDGEDVDDDNDGINDDGDLCALGNVLMSDHDSDGCDDASEDEDDDNDDVADADDRCPRGSIGAHATDFDGDGCDDEGDDDDDSDDDDVANATDDCPLSPVDFASTPATDLDADGCRDLDEDDDDDNYGVDDANDRCPASSPSRTDHDGDGCDDDIDDDDDDDDGLVDVNDDCPIGQVGLLDQTSDHDGDGCRDANEDEDDDNDTILDTNDTCPAGELIVSIATNDFDRDGCQNTGEDDDDDNDNFLNVADPCLGPGVEDIDGDRRCNSIDVCPGRDDAECSPLPLQGGTGGESQGPVDCPVGHVAVGVDYGTTNIFNRVRSSVMRLQLVCRPATATAFTGEPTLSLALTGREGETERVVVRCDEVEPDGIMVGQKVLVAPFDQGVLVSHIGAVCRRLSGGPGYTIEPAGGAGSVSTDSCPPGQDVWRAEARAASIFDAVSFRCGKRLPPR